MLHESWKRFWNSMRGFVVSRTCCVFEKRPCNDPAAEIFREPNQEAPTWIAQENKIAVFPPVFWSLKASGLLFWCFEFSAFFPVSPAFLFPTGVKITIFNISGFYVFRYFPFLIHYHNSLILFEWTQFGPFHRHKMSVPITNYVRPGRKLVAQDFCRVVFSRWTQFWIVSVQCFFPISKTSPKLKCKLTIRIFIFIITIPFFIQIYKKKHSRFYPKGFPGHSVISRHWRQRGLVRWYGCILLIFPHTVAYINIFLIPHQPSLQLTARDRL